MYHIHDIYAWDTQTLTTIYASIINVLIIYTFIVVVLGYQYLRQQQESRSRCDNSNIIYAGIPKFNTNRLKFEITTNTVLFVFPKYLL